MASKKFPYKSAYVACGHKGVPCSYGCLGCGACESACKFSAITIENGLANIDQDKCVACGACVRSCPQGIINIVEVACPIRVRCSNHQSGKEAATACPISCIACGLCAKKCPAQAISISDSLAAIDYSVCLSCGMCLVNCPRSAISDARGLLKK